MNKVHWYGYEFSVYPVGADWSDAGGIYMFCGVNSQYQWVPIYIGQADSFRNRIPSHEQWNQAVRLGATHVHAMVVQQEWTRDSIEKSLIQACQPRLNVQHK